MRKEKLNNKILNIKHNKGITLIALIITIVVLLILAVVSIGTIKDSKIIEHAQTAKNSWEESSAKESAYLKLAELQMGSLTITLEQVGYNNNAIIYDDGTINELINAMGLTIDNSQLEDGKLKIDRPELLEIYTEFEGVSVDDVDYLIYYVKCKDSDNKEKYVKIQFEMNYDTGETKLTKLNVLNELSTAIFQINNKMAENPENYKIDCNSGFTVEKAIEMLQLQYNTLINEGIAIESALVNDEKDNFNIDVIWGPEDESGKRNSDDGIIKNEGWTLYFYAECSKGSETSTIDVRATVNYDDDTHESWLQCFYFRIK